SSSVTKHSSRAPTPRLITLLVSVARHLNVKCLATRDPEESFDGGRNIITIENRARDRKRVIHSDGLLVLAILEDFFLFLNVEQLPLLSDLRQNNEHFLVYEVYNEKVW
ncbi:hypothetical protein AVEN_142934-1, partial [Araneus ventricosus]